MFLAKGTKLFAGQSCKLQKLSSLPGNLADEFRIASGLEAISYLIFSSPMFTLDAVPTQPTKNWLMTHSLGTAGLMRHGLV